jgi:hypothetical protein
MKRDNDTSLRRNEEIAKTHDVISRAKAAAPVSQRHGRDILLSNDAGFIRLNSNLD